jgi:hypothetical protein
MNIHNFFSQLETTTWRFHFTEFCQREVVVEGGSVKTVTRVVFHGTGILRVWIPTSIIFREKHRQLQSNSRLTRIESKAFSFSSLQSIVIPRSVPFIDGSAFLGVTWSEIKSCHHDLN